MVVGLKKHGRNSGTFVSSPRHATFINSRLVSFHFYFSSPINNHSVHNDCGQLLLSFLMQFWYLGYKVLSAAESVHPATLENSPTSRLYNHCRSKLLNSGELEPSSTVPVYPQNSTTLWTYPSVVYLNTLADYGFAYAS